MKLYVAIQLSVKHEIYLKRVLAGGEGRRVISFLKSQNKYANYQLIKIDDKYVDQDYVLDTKESWFDMLNKLKEYKPIDYYKDNPVALVEDYFGVKLMNYQKVFLKMTFTTENFYDKIKLSMMRRKLY